MLECTVVRSGEMLIEAIKQGEAERRRRRRRKGCWGEDLPDCANSVNEKQTGDYKLLDFA